MLDEKDQVTRERGGDVAFFRTSEHVKVMEASSRAYPQAKEYRRTAALIDHGAERSYVVDFFRVEGGGKQDYVYHAAAAHAEILGRTATAAPAAMKLYDFSGVRALAGADGVAHDVVGGRRVDLCRVEREPAGRTRVDRGRLGPA
ncbi:MAG: hypothetical protein V9F82_07350 [Dermatophilaceae bacterium]